MNYGRFQARSRLLSLFIASHWGLAALAPAEQLTRVTAGDLELTLCAAVNCIRIERLLDTQSGQELMATNPPALFSLTVRQVGTGTERRLAADGGWGQCTIQQHGARAELGWSRPLDAALAGLSVTATASADGHASAVRWKLRVDNTSTNWSVWRVVFPQVALARPGDAMRRCCSRAGRAKCNAASGTARSATMATTPAAGVPCNSWPPTARAGSRPGFTWPCTIRGAAPRTSTVKSDPATRTVQLSFDHPAPNMGLAGNGFALEGEAVWQVLRGDWFDAAMIYKALGATRGEVVAAPGSRRPRRHAALDARVERLGHDRRRPGRMRAGGEAVPRVPRRAGGLSLV